MVQVVDLCLIARRFISASHNDPTCIYIRSCPWTATRSHLQVRRLKVLRFYTSPERLLPARYFLREWYGRPATTNYPLVKGFDSVVALWEHRRGFMSDPEVGHWALKGDMGEE